MKRDLDLVRSILIAVEKAGGPVDANDLVTKGNDYAKVSYHIMLMTNRGLLDLQSFQQDANHDVIDLQVAGITWDGQDYLDAIRDRNVWAKTRKVLADSVSSTTFGVVKQTAVMVATGLITSQLGM